MIKGSLLRDAFKQLGGDMWIFDSVADTNQYYKDRGQTDEYITNLLLLISKTEDLEMKEKYTRLLENLKERSNLFTRLTGISGAVMGYEKTVLEKELSMNIGQGQVIIADIAALTTAREKEASSLKSTSIETETGPLEKKTTTETTKTAKTTKKIKTPITPKEETGFFTLPVIILIVVLIIVVFIMIGIFVLTGN